MLNTEALTWSLASFCAITLVLCVAYGLIAPASLRSMNYVAPQQFER